MAPADLLRDAVERRALADHEGKSGAGLERVRLADGRACVVKRIVPGSDLTLDLTGGGPGREYLLWREGVLDRLPLGLGHAVMDAWYEDGVTVILMRDLGDKVLTWQDRLDRLQSFQVVERLASLHRQFLGDVPMGLTPLELSLGLFAPRRISGLAAEGNELMRLACRGWDYFAELVDSDVADLVFALLEDRQPLADALAAGPVTLVHGDVATVNMAFEGEDVVLLDWSLPMAAPGALDMARFIAGCSSVVEPTREELLGAYKRAAGPAYDEGATRLALLSGLLWLGWNKALDVAEHPDPAIRQRERADLDWWVSAARLTLEVGGP